MVRAPVLRKCILHQVHPLKNPLRGRYIRFEYQCLVTVYPFFFNQSLSNKKFECVRLREDENCFVIIRLNNSPYLFFLVHWSFFAVQVFGLSMSKNLYSSLTGFSVVVSLRNLEHDISSFSYFHQENRTCNSGWLERRRMVLSVPNQDWEKYIQEQFLFRESVIISYIWIIFWSSAQIIIENNKLLVIIHGIWGRIWSFLASITGYPTDAINVLLNFDITIVGDLLHQIDFFKIQQTEKKV